MKMELVFVPSPGAGHIRSALEMSKLLVGRDDHISVTVIVIPTFFGQNVSSSYIASISTAYEEHIRCTVLSPDDQKPSDPKPTFVSYVESLKPKVRDVVAKLDDPTRPDSPKLAGFVIDMFCTAMIDVANEFGVPSYVFYTSNAGFLGLNFHVQLLDAEHKYDVDELRDSDTELDVPCLTRRFPSKCLPSVMLSKEWLPVLMYQAKRFRETKGILVNSFAELEPQAMKFFAGGETPPVYAVGPLLDLKTDGNGDSSGGEKKLEILEWLDKQPPKSVVFLCFGSMGGFGEDQTRETAVALERSGHRFIWSVRRAPPKGSMEPPGRFTNLEEILPEGFLDRTAEIGKIIEWAPQAAILANPAVGGFVSHCGWNSTLESLWFGVPMATWPLYAEQQFNAFELVEELGLAVDIRKEFRGDSILAEPELIPAEEIERGIRGLMVQDSEVRTRTKEMSEKSHVAIRKGGSSHNAIAKFIEDVRKHIS